MINQGQHRISQVYLKQFGYKDNHNKSWVSVLNKQNGQIENKSIKSFTKENNIYDLPFKDESRKKSLEDFNTKLETFYPKIINDLKSSGKLSDESCAYLLLFFPNLLLRTSIFHKIIIKFLLENKRENFFKEITSHSSDYKNLLSELDKLKPEYRVNFVIPAIWDYFIHGFQYYNFIFLTNDRGWATSDNPVMFMQNGNGFSLLHTEVEIYFPLSREFLLYVYHPNHHRDNKEWNEYPVNSIIQVNEQKALEIYSQTFRFAEPYLIFPVQYENQPLFHSD